MGHLLLDLEVSRCPQTLHDEVRSSHRGGLDGQPGECVDPNTREMGSALPCQLHAVGQRDQSTRLVGVVHHRDHHVAEQLDRLGDDVEVPIVERVETARVQDRERG